MNAFSFLHPFRILCAAAILSSATAQNVYDWNAGPMEKSKLKNQAYRAWVPAGSAPLQGTLIVIPGRHGDGRGMATDPYWQDIASTVHFALLACQFSDGEPFDYQNDPSGEVSEALNTAVQKLSQDSSHPELEKAPLAFWGHSAGGCVSGNYCNRFPNRVAAFVSAKCPRGPDGSMPAGKENIPILVLLGTKDNPAWVKDSLANTERGRDKKAPWTLALHPTEGHSLGKSAPLTAIYLKSVIALRLGQPAPGAVPDPFASPASPGELKELDIKSGWLGDAETITASSYDLFEGKKKEAAWLPNETVAQAWIAYLKDQ